MAGEHYFWLGASADSAHDDLLSAAHFISTDGASLSDEDAGRISATLIALASSGCVFNDLAIECQKPLCPICNGVAK